MSAWPPVCCLGAEVGALSADGAQRSLNGGKESHRRLNRGVHHRLHKLMHVEYWGNRALFWVNRRKENCRSPKSHLRNNCLFLAYFVSDGAGEFLNLGGDTTKNNTSIHTIVQCATASASPPQKHLHGTIAIMCFLVSGCTRRLKNMVFVLWELAHSKYTIFWTRKCVS